MKPLGTATSLLLALLLVVGCASSGAYLGEEEIPPPVRIIVYDFAASPADLPADSAVTGHYEESTTPQTAEEVELGRRLGDRLAAQLVRDIRAMGLAVERAGSGLPPHAGDLVIRGEFVSIDEGSRTKRMLIGFGAGTANLQTLVEVYQVTATGLQPIGSHEVEAGGGRMPGMLVPAQLRCGRRQRPGRRRHRRRGHRQAGGLSFEPRTRRRPDRRPGQHGALCGVRETGLDQMPVPADLRPSARSRIGVYSDTTSVICRRASPRLGRTA